MNFCYFLILFLLIYSSVVSCGGGNGSVVENSNADTNLSSQNCGNNKIDSGEACDDGNNENSDGCTANCSLEVGEAICGNGILENMECCDDGNLIEGDGCSISCVLEAGSSRNRFIDSVPPIGTVTINDGDSTAVTNDVILTLYANDNVKIAAYLLSENEISTPDVNSSDWVLIEQTTNYLARVNYRFTPGGGTRRIFVWFKDQFGNLSNMISDDIDLWSFRTIDSVGNVGDSTSIGIDSTNKSHISYCDISNERLKYATNKSGVWSTSIVDSLTVIPGQNYFINSSIAIDSGDKARITYHDVVNGDLKYASNTTGSWTTTVLQSTGDVGNDPVISLFSNDAVYILYSGYWPSVGIKSVSFGGGSAGLFQQNLNSASVRGFKSLAIDSHGNIRFVYYDDTYRGLKYTARYTGPDDVSIDGPGDPSLGYNNSLAIDSNDKIHIAYSSSAGLKYATNVNGTWEISVIDSDLTVDYRKNISIAVDLNNKLHVIYHGAYGYRLKYATNVSGAWKIFILDNTSQYSSPSITIDSNNKLHVSYLHEGTYDLKYATTALENP